MGELTILFYIIIALVIITSVSLFYVKNTVGEKSIIFLMILLGLIIGFMKFTSLPTEYVLKKILAVFISVIPLISMGLFYIKKINLFTFKIIVIISNVLGAINLILYI